MTENIFVNAVLVEIDRQYVKNSHNYRNEETVFWCLHHCQLYRWTKTDSTMMEILRFLPRSIYRQPALQSSNLDKTDLWDGNSEKYWNWQACNEKNLKDENEKFTVRQDSDDLANIKNVKSWHIVMKSFEAIPWSLMSTLPGVIDGPGLAAGMSGNDFCTFGTWEIAKPIPKFWDWEWEWNVSFPTFGIGNGNEQFNS